MGSKIRLAVCHQNRLYRESLISALDGADGMDVTGMDLRGASEGLPAGEAVEERRRFADRAV